MKEKEKVQLYETEKAFEDLKAIWEKQRTAAYHVRKEFKGLYSDMYFYLEIELELATSDDMRYILTHFVEKMRMNGWVTCNDETFLGTYDKDIFADFFYIESDLRDYISEYEIAPATLAECVWWFTSHCGNALERRAENE